MKINKVIISGGGTGGHVFPAIAIAHQIKKEFPDADVLFIGAVGKMEMGKVPEAGFPIKGLKISGFQRNFSLKNFSLPFKIILSFIQVRRIIKDFKPQVVVGVGGYASGPSLKMAAWLKIPTVITEQNSFPGKTNIILSKTVKKICVAYENLEAFFPAEKLELTGNPVRRKVVSIEGLRKKGTEAFKLNPNKKTILVVGGSLGAKTLNSSFLKGIDAIKKENIQLIWQSGKSHYADLKKEIKSDDGIILTQFINEMELAYAAADIIISRAGAMAISELCIIGKPVILVPSPNVAEDHQTKNAMVLVKDEAAILVKDSEAREKLVDTAIALIRDEEKQIKLAENIKKKGILNADERIVKVIKNVI